MSELDNCKLMDLVKVTDDRGSLTFIENNKHIPFAIKRIYYLYDVPAVISRGAHAHKELSQLLICLSGSFDVLLDDGLGRKKFHMDRPDIGLYVCPGIWRELDNFSSGSVCLVLASDFYDEKDYYRDYKEFLEAVKKQL